MYLFVVVCFSDEYEEAIKVQWPFFSLKDIVYLKDIHSFSYELVFVFFTYGLCLLVIILRRVQRSRGTSCT